MLLIVETQTDGGIGSFEVTLPSDFSYNERSWSLAENDDGSNFARYFLNGAQIWQSTTHGWSFVEGNLTAAQLDSDTLHTIEIEIHGFFSATEHGYGGLALIYQVPQ